MKKFNHKWFLEKCKNIGVLDKINILSEYKNSKTKVKVQCKIHPNQIFESYPSVIFRNKYCCPECYKNYKHTKYAYTNKDIELKLIEENINFELIDNYINYHTPIWFKCKDCKNLWHVAPTTIFSKKIQCPWCKDTISFPNKFIRNFLFMVNVKDFIPEFNDNWTQGKIYDAYFSCNNKKYLVEMDGVFHFEEHKEKIKKSLDFRKNIDRLKDKLAKENNYILIRINCLDSSPNSIKREILKSKLNELFDLNNFNWDECIQKSLNNLVKQVCEYYNNNSNATSLDFQKVFNISSCTVRNYLTKGAEIGLCDYNSVTNNKQTKKFKMYDKNKRKIKDFYSIIQCVAYLKEVYNIDINRHTISLRLKNNDTRPVKGFVFKL